MIGDVEIWICYDVECGEETTIYLDKRTSNFFATHAQEDPLGINIHFFTIFLNVGFVNHTSKVRNDFRHQLTNSQSTKL